MDDILHEIMRLLLVPELLNASTVSKSWNAAAIYFIYRTIPPTYRNNVDDPELSYRESNACIDLERLCLSLERNPFNGAFVKSIEFFSDIFSVSSRLRNADQGPLELEDIRSLVKQILNRCTKLQRIFLNDAIVNERRWIDNTVLDAVPDTITHFSISSMFDSRKYDSSYPELKDLNATITDNGLIRLFKRTNITNCAFLVDEESTISPYCVFECISNAEKIRCLELCLSEEWSDETIRVGEVDITVMQNLARIIAASNIKRLELSSNEVFDEHNLSTKALFASFSGLRHIDYLSVGMTRRIGDIQKSLEALIAFENDSKRFEILETFNWDDSVSMNDLPTLGCLFSLCGATLTRLTLVFNDHDILARAIKVVGDYLPKLKALGMSVLYERGDDHNVLEHHLDDLVSNCKDLKHLFLPFCNCDAGNLIIIANIDFLSLDEMPRIGTFLQSFKDSRSKRLVARNIVNFDVNEIGNALMFGCFKHKHDIVLQYKGRSNISHAEFLGALLQSDLTLFPRYMKVDVLEFSLTLRKVEGSLEVYSASSNTWISTLLI